jgi:hypothetical protein
VSCSLRSAFPIEGVDDLALITKLVDLLRKGDLILYLFDVSFPGLAHRANHPHSHIAAAYVVASARFVDSPGNSCIHFFLLIALYVFYLFLIVP